MAAVKIDKELLIKHRFWIGLGLCIIFVLVVLLMLPISVGSAVEAKKKEYEGSLGNLKGIKEVKNQFWVDALKTKDAHVEKKKNEVWQEAWKTQENMMTWPPNLEDWYTKYKYFGDKIAVSDRNKFVSEYDYQIYDVVQACQPLNEEGKGVVQFNGGYNAVLGLERSFVRPPSDADIWLAQEDLWVKRELLAIIGDTNNYVARFTEVLPDAPAAPPAPPAPKKEDKAVGDADKEPEKDAKPAAPPPPPKVVTDPMHRKFRNSFWELDLKLTRDDKGIYWVSGTIKNIGKAKQAIDTDFNVYLDDTIDADTPYATVHAARLPMNVGESFPFKEVRCDQNKSISGLYAVMQVLTWQTGPVKRIDRIELGHPSSRTASRSLKPPLWIPKPEAAPEADSPPAGMDMASMRGGRGGPGGASTTASDQTESGLNKNRYTDANAQVRHMPIAMAVLMDEDHIHDFLGALANSRLKIQTLQIHWNHSRAKVKPAIGEEDPDTVRDRRPVAGSQPSRPTAANQPPMPGMGGAMGRRQDQMAKQGMAGQARPGAMGGFGAGQKFSSGGFGRGGSGGPGYGGMGLGGFGLGGIGKQVSAGRPVASGTSSTSMSEEEEPMTLVELSVYGLATLYERYPAKQEAPADSTTAAK